MKSFQLLLLIGFLLGVQCMRAQGDTLSRIPPVLHDVRQGHISTGAQEANHRHSLSLQWGVYIPTGKGCGNLLLCGFQSRQLFFGLADCLCQQFLLLCYQHRIGRIEF